MLRRPSSPTASTVQVDQIVFRSLVVKDGPAPKWYCKCKRLAWKQQALWRFEKNVSFSQGRGGSLGWKSPVGGCVGAVHFRVFF